MWYIQEKIKKLFKNKFSEDYTAFKNGSDNFETWLGVFNFIIKTQNIENILKIVDINQNIKRI